MLRMAEVGNDTLILQLKIEIARLKQPRQFTGPRHGVFILTQIKQARNNACYACTGADKTFTVALKHRKGCARLIVKIVHVRFTDKLN